MFNSLLLPLDRSPLAECALSHAVAIARAFDGRITLLHVMERPREERRRRAMDPLTWQVRQAEAKAYLHGLGSRLLASGLPAETLLLEGAAAEQIIGCADGRGAELIILSSHGQSGLSDWGISSVGQKIALRARTSVMIARATEAPPTEMTGLRYQRILVPLDGTPRAESVLPAAAALARAHGARILLAHVVQKPALPRRTLPSREDVELVGRLIDRNRAEATLYLDQLRSRLAGEVAMRVLVSDHLSATLHELVEEEGTDLVLLSAHGRSRETRGLYGDVVSHFIAYGTTPLIILQDRPSIPGEAAGGGPGKP